MGWGWRGEKKEILTKKAGQALHFVKAWQRTRGTAFVLSTPSPNFRLPPLVIWQYPLSETLLDEGGADMLGNFGGASSRPHKPPSAPTSRCC